MPTLLVYNLGQIGIDVVNSDIHMQDGSLLNSQNASYSPVDAEITLKKRDGMSKINTTATSTPLLTMVSLPFNDPS